MSGAQSRMADAMLRVCGGSVVMLRVPGAAIPGDDAEQLGQATPEFQDLPLGPAVWRKARTATDGELVISATAVELIVGTLAYDSAAVLFRTAAGVLVDGDLLEIVSAVGITARGDVAVYRVVVKGSQALVA
ncbi:MAG: hypothetical protein ACRYFU_14880 [Janthinobacterium lividum]